MRFESFQQFKEMASYWVCESVYLRNGMTLRYALYGAAIPKRGHAIILPDRDEHIEKYSELAEELAQYEWQASVLEWRGQGLSYGNQNLKQPDDLVNNEIGWFMTSVADLNEFWKQVWDDKYQKEPVLIIAHGVGGHIALRWLMHNQQIASQLRGVVLSAPFLGLPPTRMPGWISVCWTVGMDCLSSFGMEGYVLTKNFPQLAEMRQLGSLFENNPFTRDQKRFEIMEKWLSYKKEYMPASMTWGWAISALYSCYSLQFELKTGGKGYFKYFAQYLMLIVKSLMGFHKGSLSEKLRCYSESARLHVPVLLLMAAQDPFGYGKAHRGLAQNFSHCESLVFENSKHDLLQECDSIRDQIWARLERFLHP